MGAEWELELAYCLLDTKCSVEVVLNDAVGRLGFFTVSSLTLVSMSSQSPIDG